MQFAIQTDATAAIGEPKQEHKAHNMAASNNDLSIIAWSHHLHMGATLCPHPIRGEPRIQHHAKRWQQTINCKIFAGKGSIKADDVSFAAIIYITLVSAI